MEPGNATIQTQNSNTSQSKFTIKLIGDANDLSDLVSDLRTEYYFDKPSDQEATTVKMKNDEPNPLPPKKKLKMTEEVLPRRVILVVPKDSPPRYPLYSKNLRNSYNKSINTISTNDSTKKNYKQNSVQMENEQKADGQLLKNSPSKSFQDNSSNKSVDDANKSNLYTEKDENLSLLHQISIDENVAHEEIVKNDSWQFDSSLIDGTEFNNYEYHRTLSNSMETVHKMNGVESTVINVNQKKNSPRSSKSSNSKRSSRGSGSTSHSQGLKNISKKLELQRSLIKRKLIAELCSSRSMSPPKELPSGAVKNANSPSENSQLSNLNTSEPQMKLRNRKQESFLLNDLSPIRKYNSSTAAKNRRSLNRRKSTNVPLNVSKDKQLKSLESIPSTGAVEVVKNETSPAPINSNALFLDTILPLSPSVSGQRKSPEVPANHMSPEMNIKPPNELRSYGLSFLHNDQNLILNSLGQEKVKVESLTPRRIITRRSLNTEKQKQLPQNEKISNMTIFKISTPINTSELNRKSKIQTQQKLITFKVVGAEKLQQLQNQIKNNLSFESGSHQFSHLNIPESPMEIEQHNSSHLNESSNNLFSTSEQSNLIAEKNQESSYKNTSIKSPQIRVNGLMLRAPDPNLLNNLALKEKIQEFRELNKFRIKTSLAVEKVQKNNMETELINPTVIPEISESLVSTTTVESGQLDKKTKDCQLCDRLRLEVNEQWKLITQLKLRLNNFQSNDECNFQQNNKHHLVEDKDISLMLMKQIEETNKKITEELRKEKIYNSKLRLSLTNRDKYIKELEDKLSRVSKIFEETEKNAIQLKKQLGLPKVANLFSTQNSTTSDFLDIKNNIINKT